MASINDHYNADPPLTAETADYLTNLHRKALHLAYFTIAYNVVECVLALVAGAWAGSIALVGFGLDSLVESLSGGVMIYRFARHATLSPAEEERLERRAVKIVGYTFFILAAYVLYESLEKLIFQEPPAPSLLGLVHRPGLHHRHARVVRSQVPDGKILGQRQPHGRLQADPGLRHVIRGPAHRPGAQLLVRHLAG